MHDLHTISSTQAMTIRILTEGGAEVGAATTDLATPLHWAVVHGQADAAIALLSAGVCIVDSYGWWWRWWQVVVVVGVIATTTRGHEDAALGRCAALLHA